MIRVIDACEQPTRSGARGFRSHRPRSLLTLRKFCRIGDSYEQGLQSFAVDRRLTDKMWCLKWIGNSSSAG